MLLGLLLAVFDDALDVDARRAAQHEVARRLGVGWKRVGPPREIVPYPVRVLREAEAIHAEPDAFRRRAQLRALGGLCGVAWTLLPPAPAPFVSEVFSALSDVDLDSRASVLAALRQPSGSATPIDGLIDWALGAWRDPDPRLDRVPGLLDQIAASLPSIRDWAEETGSTPTRLAWPEAVRRSTDWHRTRFIGARLGEPVPDALVVVRDADGWTLQRLLTKRQFILEGGAMGHCIGGPLDREGQPSGESHYIQESRDGTRAFFSVRRPDRRIAATIEVERASTSIVQVQGPQDGPVGPEAEAKIATLFAEAGEPLLPPMFKRILTLGGLYVVPQKDRIAAAAEVPAAYAQAFLHGTPLRDSFNASVEEGMQWAAERRGTHGSAVGASTIFHALERWFVGKIELFDPVWFGFSVRIPGATASFQFRRSTPETWATAVGPFTAGISFLGRADNSFFAAESPAHAVLLAIGFPLSTDEASRDRYPDLSDAARARAYSAGLEPLSPASAWTSALAGSG